MDTGIATLGINLGARIALNFVMAVIMPCGTFLVCKATFLCHRYLLPPYVNNEAFRIEV